MAKILVIDDEPSLRKILRHTLERAGHEVIEASDGNVGTRIYRTEKIDLMITDLIMPNKEGIETILEAKNAHPTLNIIAISGGGHSAGPDFLRMAKIMGADLAFRKPFQPKEIVAAVDELLSKAA